MTLPEEPQLQKQERLSLLKQRAQAVLNQVAHESRELDDAQDASQQHTLKLLEELRTYQVELELQNEELRAAQHDAELARQRYQYLFLHLPLAAMVVDSQGVIDECNALADTLLGARKPHVNADRRLWRLLSAQDRTRVHQALRDVAMGEASALSRVTTSRTDANAPVFDLHLIGLSIDYKLDRRVLMLWVDRSAEQAREADQRFYTSLIDSSDTFIYAVDKDGVVLLANQALLNFLGRRQDEVVGHSREQFMPVRDAVLQRAADQKVLASEQTLTVEERMHLVPHGVPSDFLTRKFPLRDLAGGVYAVGGISTDITFLKNHQRQMLLSEAVFWNCSETIIITDADTRIVRVNPAFTRQTGFAADTVIGQKTNVLKSGRHDVAFYQAMWQAINGSGAWSGELNNRRADGSFYTVWSSINVVRDTAGVVINYIATQTDVTQLHNVQLALAHQASYDNLTGLPNRALFNDRLAQLTSAALRHGKTFALLFIDLDRFKEVNDTLGHQVGDALLQEVAGRLQQSVRSEDTVARIGGDEFVVLLPNTDATGALAVAENLLDKVRAPVQLQDALVYHPMSSVGMAMFPHDGNTPDLLLRSADLAMYEAKIGGRNRFAVYRPELSQVNDQTFALQNALTQAIEQQQFRVYFQPKLQLSDGAIVGAEVLVRWQRTEQELVLPGEFIAVAERLGLLVKLDRWVMQEALRQLGEWLAQGRWQAGWRLAVNQNVADLQRADMVGELMALLQRYRVSANAIELEITEDALLNHTAEQLERLRQLREMGVSVAIDDFGTGYSSLAYLRKLPISVIKIDQGFVRGMLSDENDAVLVQTIVNMAHNLGHAVVAEGIEEEPQRQHLSDLGVEFGQGFLFDRALSAQDFAAHWLKAQAPTAPPVRLMDKPG